MRRYDGVAVLAIFLKVSKKCLTLHEAYACCLTYCSKNKFPLYFLILYHVRRKGSEWNTGILAYFGSGLTKTYLRGDPALRTTLAHQATDGQPEVEDM